MRTFAPLATFATEGCCLGAVWGSCRCVCPGKQGIDPFPAARLQEADGLVGKIIPAPAGNRALPLPKTNASAGTQNLPESNSHATQKGRKGRNRLKHRRAAPLPCACLIIQQDGSRPIREPQRRDGPIRPVRIGVCVPCAALAALALNGSEDVDAFALPASPPGVDSPRTTR